MSIVVHIARNINARNTGGLSFDNRLETKITKQEDIRIICNTAQFIFIVIRRSLNRENANMKMLFMVVEHFKDGKTKDIYCRLKEKGRMMPEGLKYLDSWVSADFNRCFQLMECDDPTLFQEWVLQWQDLFELEIIPVVTSKNTIKIVNKSP